MFYPGSLFMKYNAYVAEGGNEGGRGATPTSISTDFYDMKTLLLEFGNDIFIGFKMPVFQPFYAMKLKTSNFKVLAFCSQ